MLSTARLSLFSGARPSCSRSLSTTSLCSAAVAVAPTRITASMKQLLPPKKSPFVRIDGPYKVYKPLTPSIRHRRDVYNPHLYTGAPIRVLTVAKRKTGGRNKAGRITVRSVGGGARQRIRIVDFKRSEPGKCDVIRIEFDPRRSAHIALIRQRNPKAKQVFSYILAPDGIRAGDVVESFRYGIPDGFVEGFIDERKSIPPPKEDKGRNRGEKHTAPAVVEEPSLSKPKEPEYDEDSVAELEAELAALEAAAEQEALEAQALKAEHEVEEGGALPPVEELEESIEAEDGAGTEGEFLPDPAAALDRTPPQGAIDAQPDFQQPAQPVSRLNPAVQAKMAEHVRGATATTSQLALGVLRMTTIKPGNVLPLRLIPRGVQIHNISLHPYGPMKLVRSAGSYGEVVVHEPDGKYSHVRLQSGEVRKIGQECCATIGKVSNEHWKGRMLGKAGRSRRLGIRPHVRGVAMNAVDHPHGGGRGKSKGNKHPRSIYG
ncbi:hypothetical protein DACRYDRAFT_115847, partial [Dacryopinax primogenitus]